MQELIAEVIPELDRACTQLAMYIVSYVHNSEQYTIDRKIFTELYFCVLNFSASNFRHLAPIYIVGTARENV